MTTLQIDTNDKNAIQEIKDFAMQKFHFKVKIVKTPKVYSVDEKLKALKSNKFQRKGNLAEAFSSLNKKIGNLQNIDVDKAKEEYFAKKYSL